MKHCLFVAFTSLFLLMSSVSFAGDHPQAHFGKYGIRKQVTTSAYQKYVGSTVKYIPAFCKNGYTIDDEMFFKKGGKEDIEYIIEKIDEKENRMTFHLREKEGKKKVKMIINNGYEYYSYGKYTYCVEDSYTVPLLLMDAYNQDYDRYVGKRYPEDTSSPIHFTVTDMILAPGHEYAEYPTILFQIKNENSGEVLTIDPDHIDYYDNIGNVYSSNKYKHTYTVIGVERKKSDYYPYNIETQYILSNSLNGKQKRVNILSAASAYNGDDSGHFTSTLKKVEKPTNPDIRYGETTVITDMGVSKYSYVDNIIDIVIVAQDTQFSFSIKNVSDNSIKVVWNDAVFIDVDGRTSRVMHAGTKYSQRDGDQPASIIIKSARLDDLAAPTDKVYYSEVFKEWTSKSLYEKANKSKSGEVIKLMLPIQVKDVINEYVFEFAVKYVFDNPELLSNDYYDRLPVLRL